MELSQRLDLGALVEGTEEQDASVEERLAGILARITGEDVEPEKTLNELGVSSLDRIELAIRTEEEFGVQIEDSLYTDALTVRALAEILARKE
ncbi:acyl carrier protein [Corynebacterium sanguinis]|uniref:acyl carrier protein n=1 Tax=Corynebacterium sanguinis TaxID=2594913 RepID=UPI0010AA7F4B|nr:acyl carrier protein [Corynebacterium sanguinis]MCT1627949.1 acyl carrier protein [Corynebacterium sanguinis]